MIKPNREKPKICVIAADKKLTNSRNLFHFLCKNPAKIHFELAPPHRFQAVPYGCCWYGSH